MMKRKILKLIHNSLISEPEKWSFGRYEATNGKIIIWLANRYYGTEANYGSIKIGGSCAFWFLLPWQWWRVSLIKAVEKAQFNLEFKNKC